MSDRRVQRRDSPAWDAFREDLDGYRQDPWFGRWWWAFERPIWAIAVFRLGQRLLELKSGRLQNLVLLAYRFLHVVTQAATGIEIMPNTQIGPGLRIRHGTGLVINAGAVIGSRVVLRQGVTIGARRSGETAMPTVGDDVEFGAYAQVLGPVTIGDRARVAALSVVLSDVPAGVTVAGTPAVPVGRRRPHHG